MAKKALVQWAAPRGNARDELWGMEHTRITLEDVFGDDVHLARVRSLSNGRGHDYILRFRENVMVQDGDDKTLLAASAYVPQNGRVRMLVDPKLTTSASLRPQSCSSSAWG